MRVRTLLPLILVLIAIFVLRIPSFFEPHWYGDEEIYLAIGQAIQRGALLYRDIWDNKPPLLYLIYAISPTILWAKFAATVCVLGTVAGMYKISQRIFSAKFPDWGEVSEGKKVVFISTIVALLTGIFLSIPLLEGTIANAELFFVLPIVWSAYLFLPEVFRVGKVISPRIWIGLLTAAAFLLKVPALFDFAGIFLATSLVLMAEDQKFHFSLNKTLHNIFDLVIYFSVCGLFFFVPVLLVVLYFFFNHALSDFLIAAFSQNASYVAVDAGPLAKLSNPLFVKAFVLLAFFVFDKVLFLKKKISWQLLFLSTWFAFSLYGALLSSRPYLHYLLQIVPPASILLVYLLVNIRKYFVCLAVFVFVFVALGSMFKGAFALDTRTYYQNFWDYVSQRKDWVSYANYFDSRTTNSYAIGDYLKQNSKPSDSIFVWADAASVYVLSERAPATRFIQAHHLTTIDPKNYDLVIEKLKSAKPKFIVVLQPKHFAFPKLDSLVAKDYRPTVLFGDLQVYQYFGTKSRSLGVN